MYSFNRIIRCHKYGKPGYQCGNTGVCHLYPEGDEKREHNALQKALKDRADIEAAKAKPQKYVPLIRIPRV